MIIYYDNKKEKLNILINISACFQQFCYIVKPCPPLSQQESKRYDDNMICITVTNDSQRSQNARNIIKGNQKINDNENFL